MGQRSVSLMFCITMLLALPAAACLHTTTKKKGGQNIELSSSSFSEGEAIPKKHTCDGEDTSPPLKWRGIPGTAASLAIICDDPDAPGGTWVHWVVYDLPSNLSALSEALSTTASIPESAMEGTNDFKRIGYGGPCPPPGSAHRYFFRLYALDTKLNLKPGAAKSELVNAMNGHILAEGKLMGIYSRN